jgi:beta-phosphoglucomutase family hydrolase
MKRATITIEGFEAEAVIFDLDGVVTDTAEVHAAAWKELFDGYLRARSDRTGEPFVPFDKKEDYLRYVDGKPRFDGVRSFLASRGIELREGEMAEGDSAETVIGLGLRKNRYFNARLLEGVRSYPSSVRLLNRLKGGGIPMAIVSSSRNCVPVLAAAGLEDLFDAKVDGIDAANAGLNGKPDPDIFLAASDALEVGPDRAVVIEDALAGVEAGRRGGFGLVVGVDRRGGQAEALRQQGADVVVGDLSELSVQGPRNDDAVAAGG